MEISGPRSIAYVYPPYLRLISLSLCISLATCSFLSWRHAAFGTLRTNRRKIANNQAANCQVFARQFSIKYVVTVEPNDWQTHPANIRTKVSHQPQLVLPRLSQQPTTIIVRANNNSWDGDDLRWSSKASRRFYRQLLGGLGSDGELITVRNTLVAINVATFFYQAITTINSIRLRHPSFWPSKAPTILLDSLWGATYPGPLTLDFVHNKQWSMLQPHRFITAGFLHGGIVHLIANMNALLNLPAWLETGLGAPLYLTTYVAAIVGGNIFDNVINLDSADSLCLGASGGICGLYGLMYVSLLRMENKSAAFRVLKGMGILFLYGIVFSSISNAGHIGGFIVGLLVGIVSGPSYVRSYTMRRKNSLEVDLLPRDYRQAMGYDKKPTARAYVPVQMLWLMTFLAIICSPLPKYRTIPNLIIRGIINPGTLYKQML